MTGGARSRAACDSELTLASCTVTSAIIMIEAVGHRLGAQVRVHCLIARNGMTLMGAGLFSLTRSRIPGRFMQAQPECRQWHWQPEYRAHSCDWQSLGETPDRQRAGVRVTGPGTASVTRWPELLL